MKEQALIVLLLLLIELSLQSDMKNFISQKLRVPVAAALRNAVYPALWPYTSQDFTRQDESEDGLFYSEPRLVYHIDDNAVNSLTAFYRQNLKPHSRILDLCSSWVSHYPPDVAYSEIVGLGMNLNELNENPQLTKRISQNLNQNQYLPFESEYFDYITLVVSVDYLVYPLEVFKEMNRVLKPGGKAFISQSNRCFPSKAIDIWLRTSDIEHAYIIGSYFHYSGGFSKPEGIDISPDDPTSDPIFVVHSTKLAN